MANGLPPRPQVIRVGALHGDLRCRLLFFDKSQTRLGPMTEVSVDQLDAQADGPRTVRLTQWIGETDHDVTPSSNAQSRYEVNTPHGTGTAQGTSFHVQVNKSQITHIAVDEGAVAVANLNVL
jgi:hypothetical protein